MSEVSVHRSPTIVVMGVSGCGKSFLAKALSRRLQIAFLEGDDLHPPENVDRMTVGFPLEDRHRWPWLVQIATRIQNEHGPMVVACSALKRSYRDLLRESGRPVLFVHLTAEPSLLQGRLQRRRRHFMPAALLTSQLATLEPLEEDELAQGALVLDTSLPEAEKTEKVVDAWHKSSAREKDDSPEQ